MKFPGLLALIGGFCYLWHMTTVRGQTPGEDWRTKAEATDYRETARYDETMAYCRRLAAASEFIHLETIGRSPEGREIVAVIVSLDKAFTPEAAQAGGKEILLVNACIHPGECEGKDAGLALIRDLIIRGQYKTNGLLDHAILLFVPIHGVDGHERFGPYNRINQNGPAEMGWRATAQNYNLNRDWVKADAPEMRAMLGFYTRWLPDLFIDVHTTDGADYQYDITYSLENFANQHPAIVAWQREAFDGSIFPALKAMGHKLSPYIVLNDPAQPLSGFNEGPAAARFSTGYGALRNRAVLLLETHMLKDYHNRVTATYDLVMQTLAYFSKSPGKLRQAAQAADRETVELGRAYDAARRVPLSFKQGAGHVPFEFLGYECQRELSAVSGAMMIHYDPAKPVTFTVPLFNEVLTDREVCPPLGYLVPAAWTTIFDRLTLHGIKYQTLTQPLTQDVETYHFEHAEWQPHPFENHHLIKEVKFRSERHRMTFPAGSAVVYLDQSAAKVAIQLLEPDAPDSLLRWGYLDSIFEEKEYADERVMEVMARDMMAKDPALKAEFESKVQADPSFAGSPAERLDFFYQRTPYYDGRLNIYPVGRIFERLTDAR